MSREEIDKLHKEREKSRTHLTHIKDKRVIPWLIEINEMSMLSAFAKFDDDNDAFAAIVKSISSSDTTRSHFAASILSRSNRSEAINVLLDHHNHSNPSVRRVAVRAADRMDREAALTMLREHFNDPDTEIAESARRIYTRFTGEDAE